MWMDCRCECKCVSDQNAAPFWAEIHEVMCEKVDAQNWN